MAKQGLSKKELEEYIAYLRQKEYDADRTATKSNQEGDNEFYNGKAEGLKEAYNYLRQKLKSKD